MKRLDTVNIFPRGFFFFLDGTSFKKILTEEIKMFLGHEKLIFIHSVERKEEEIKNFWLWHWLWIDIFFGKFYLNLFFFFFFRDVNILNVLLNLLEICKIFR